ncbi:MAG: HEAT repeat domain-containing protein [Pirellulales bacterium]
MHGRLPSLLPWAISSVVALAGCAETASRMNDVVTRPFRKTPEQELGIKTPKDRVAELRALTKRAKRQSLAEQERFVAELAEEIKRENEPWVRREVLRALSAYPQPAAGAVLVAALGDSDVETRRVACAGLGVRGDQTAVRELARVVASDTNVDVRLAAVGALGRSGNREALGPLAEALVDSDPAMQSQAQRALVAASGRDFGNNAQAWREYAQTGNSGTAEVSFAEKLRRTLY